MGKKRIGKVELVLYVSPEVYEAVKALAPAGGLSKYVSDWFENKWQEPVREKEVPAQRVVTSPNKQNDHSKSVPELRALVQFEEQEDMEEPAPKAEYREPVIDYSDSQDWWENKKRR